MREQRKQWGQRLGVLLLTVALLLSACPMFGCGEEKPPRTTLAHALLDQGYAIVTALEASQTVQTAVSQIERTFLQIDAEHRIPVRTDYVQHGNAVPQNAKEILVGVTTRTSSQSACQTLLSARPNSQNDYQITFLEGEVLLVGGCDSAVAAAAELFCAMLSQSAEQYPIGRYDSGILTHNWPLNTLGAQPLQQVSLLLPTEADPALQALALTLQDAVYAVSGYRLPIRYDSSDAQGYEVALGLTNRPISIAAKQILSQNRPNCAHDGVILENASLALLGGTHRALETLVASFCASYLTDSAQAELVGKSTPFYGDAMPTVSVLTNDLSRYRIVYADSADFDTRLLAWEMQQYFYTVCGYDLPIVTDTASQDPAILEILIGQTDRPFHSIPQKDAFAVSTDAVGNLLLEAGHYAGLQQAWRTLCSSFASQSPTAWQIPALAGKVEDVAISYQVDADLTWQFQSDLATTYQNRTQLAGFDFSQVYDLVYSDEFYGDTLQYEKWSLSDNATMPGVTLSADPSVLRVQDGQLQLFVRVQDAEKDTFVTSYSVTTHDTMNFSGGYLEMRASLPLYGKGEYPSFWCSSHSAVLYQQAYRQSHGGTLYDSGYAVEVDILEGFSTDAFVLPNIQKHFYLKTQQDYVGTPAVLSLSGYAQQAPHSNTTRYLFADGADARSMHTYGFLWTDSLMAFSVDGKFYCVCPLDDPAISPTYRKEHTTEYRTFGKEGLQKENMGLSVLLNHLVVTAPYAQRYPWAKEHAVQRTDYQTLFPLCYAVDYLRLYQTSKEMLYTPKEVGKGEIFYRPDRFTVSQ